MLESPHTCWENTLMSSADSLVKAWPAAAPEAPPLLDERMSRRLLKDPELALRHLRATPADAPLLLGGLLGAVGQLPEPLLQQVLEACAPEHVPAELRARVVGAALARKEVPGVTALHQALARDLARGGGDAGLLHAYVEKAGVPEAVAVQWLGSALPVLRELGAVGLVHAGRLLVHALNVLLEDGGRGRIAQLEAQSEQPQLLREALAYVQLGRCLVAPTREALEDVLQAGPPPTWSLGHGLEGWRACRVEEGLPGAPARGLPSVHDSMEVSRVALRLLLQQDMLPQALELLAAFREREWYGLLKGAGEPAVLERLTRLTLRREVPPSGTVVAGLLTLALEPQAPPEPPTFHPPSEPQPAQRVLAVVEEIRPQVEALPLTQPFADSGSADGRSIFVSHLRRVLAHTPGEVDRVEAFLGTDAGQVLARLTELPNPAQAAQLFSRWFLAFATQEEWDTAFHLVWRHTEHLPEWVMQASVEALLAYARAGADAGLAALLAGHREGPRLLERMVEEASEVGLRASAAARLLLEGRPVPKLEGLELRVRVVGRLKQAAGAQPRPELVEQVEAMLRAEPERLLVAGDTLGAALYNALGIARAVGREDLSRRALEVWLVALEGSRGLDQASRLILHEHVPAGDEALRQRVAEALARLSAERLSEVLWRLPERLAEAWARSARTPRRVRLVALWVALHAPGLEAREVDLSEDGWLLAELLDRMAASFERSRPVLEELLRAAVRLMVRRPPSAAELREQTDTYARVSEHLRGWVLGPQGPELCRLLRSELVEQVGRALREGAERPVPVLECWLRCAGVLRERRLAEGLERLEERLPGPVREAREELALAPLVDDVETVVLALGELRVP